MKPRQLVALLLAFLIGASGMFLVMRTKHQESDDWATVTSYLLQFHTMVLPSELPPGFQTVHPRTINDQPALGFYSENQPIVTICTGDVGKCRQLSPTDTVLREGAEADQRYVVLVSSSDGPRQSMEQRLTDFWRTTPLTTGRPEWLPKRSA